MKNEPGSVAIEEFVGLKSKMYSFLVNNEERGKRCKQIFCCNINSQRI